MSDDILARAKDEIEWYDRGATPDGEIIRDLVESLREARAAIARVRALHESGHIGGGYHTGSEYICEECSRLYCDPVPYPCPTIRALDGID